MRDNPLLVLGAIVALLAFVSITARLGGFDRWLYDGTPDEHVRGLEGR